MQLMTITREKRTLISSPWFRPSEQGVSDVYRLAEDTQTHRATDIHWSEAVNTEYLERTTREQETVSSEKATTQSGKLYEHSAGVLFARVSKRNWILVSNERKRNSSAMRLMKHYVLKTICFYMCCLSSCGTSYYWWSDFSLSHFHFPQTFTAGGPGAAKLIFTCLLECFLTAT